MSELVSQLTTGFWNIETPNGTFHSIPINDEDFNFQEFNEIETVYNILDRREIEGKINAITLWDKEYTESLALLISGLENNYEDSNKHYLFSLSPDTAKRINGAPRLTDYGHYLNQFLPKLISIGCYICEVECRDFDC
ncbi:hypothetical protein ACI6Q2_12100 [Chitinophagaceae bacterium LWZ2-11]